MVQLNINMPASCEDCPYKGARWCYLEVLRKKEPKEVPKEGRAEWCPLVEVEDMTENSKCPMVDNCHDEKHTFPAINTEQRRVLDEIGKKQETLLDVVKAWNNEIEKHGYVN